MRRLALLALPFLAACLDRQEEITVHPDGSAEVSLRYRGDAGDFDDQLDFPDWNVQRTTETEQTDQGPREKTVWSASTHLASLDDYPDTFAVAATPHGDRRLHWNTTLRIGTRHGLRVYEFERSYVQTEVAHYQRVDDEVYGDPEFRALLERMGDRGLDALDDVGRTRLFEFASRAELAKQMELAARAACALTPRWDERLEIAGRLHACLREAVGPDAIADAVRRLLDAPEADRGTISRGVQADLRRRVVDAARADGFGDAYAAEAAAHDAGLSLMDDGFHVRVRFPAPVVAGNYKSLEENDTVALWEFGGKDLADRAVVLRAVAIEGR